MPKVKCSFEECRLPAQRIVGDCSFCEGSFCKNHRLLEDHDCQNLEDCKKALHAANAMQLNKERTQVIKTA
jgi:predicted nucleic acid binding AN1-type Zn finger protein